MDRLTMRDDKKMYFTGERLFEKCGDIFCPHGKNCEKIKSREWKYGNYQR